MKNPASTALPIKVLHIAQTAQGGVGSYLEEIMPLQSERYGREAVRAILPEEHAAAFPGLSSRWMRNFSGHSGRLISSLRMAALAFTVVREWRPHIVHLHSTFAGLVMRPFLWALPHRPRIIYCPHGWAFDRKTGRVETLAASAMERLLSRLCDAIICVSANDFHRALAMRLPPGSLRVVRNGIADLPTPAVPAPRGDPWPEGVRRILFVGRLDRQKGADVLFAAMRVLGDSAFAVVVGSSVVGDDGLAATAPANVSIAGWLSRPQIAELYAGAEVLVAPSRWEGLPMVAIEAMRAGLPVVATRAGGLPEIVEDGISGRLVEVDDAEQLARVLARLDSATLREMGARARQRYLRDFQIDRVIRELDGIYRSLALDAADRVAAGPRVDRKRP